jgi:hypothetical protein
MSVARLWRDSATCAGGNFAVITWFGISGMLHIVHISEFESYMPSHAVGRHRRSLGRSSKAEMPASDDCGGGLSPTSSISTRSHETHGGRDDSKRRNHLCPDCDHTQK